MLTVSEKRRIKMRDAENHNWIMENVRYNFEAFSQKVELNFILFSKF